MTIAAGENTFDLDPPRRPSLEDFGGDELEDDPDDPPDPATMPDAASEITARQFRAAVGVVIVAAMVEVTFTAGTPAVSRVDSVRGLVNGHPEVFTVTHPGTGHVKLAWTADTFPPDGPAPRAFIIENVSAAAPVAVMGTNSVDVYTRNDAGTATDMNFAVDLYRDST